MNKKLIGIIIAIVAIIAIIAGLFVVKPWESKDNTDHTITSDELADDLDDYIPDMDKDEIKEELDKELTDEQKDTLNDAINSAIIDGDIEVNEEDNTITYTDGNGATVTENIDEDIKNMTQEEIDQTVQNTQDYLQSIIDGTGGNPSDPGDNGNTGSNSNNTTKDDYGTDSTMPENDTTQPSTSNESSQGGSTMTPEEYEEWAKQWGMVGTSNEGSVDPNDPGYQDWLTGQLEPAN